MIKFTYISLLIFSFFIIHVQAYAEEINTEEKKLTSIDLKYITAGDVISVLKSLIDKSVSISEKNNKLQISGTEKNTKSILHITSQIDTPAMTLTIAFIASSRKIDFKSTPQSRNISSQSMPITERQWVTLNTGLSIPVSERKRHADGTETQSFTYKKINKSYVFKIHEFSSWSVIQVGSNNSLINPNVSDTIEHTKLDTTIVGKTGEWLEVNSGNQTSEDKHPIYLYIKVKESEIKSEAKTIP
jgi:hypothetical protein